MPKRELSPESLEFTRPARRKLSLPPLRGLLALPSEVVVELLHYIYPKHFVEEECAKRIACRMCDWGRYRLELTLLGREALNLLLVNRAMAAMASWNWTWMYRHRLVRFHAELHKAFMLACISRLIRDTKGKVPNWEIEAIYETAERRRPPLGREYALEQAVLRPQLRNRRGSNRKLAVWMLSDRPLPLDWMPLR